MGGSDFRENIPPHMEGEFFEIIKHPPPYGGDEISILRTVPPHMGGTQKSRKNIPPHMEGEFSKMTSFSIFTKNPPSYG